MPVILNLLLALQSASSKPMNALIWHKVAGLSGAAAVGLGAYGAHAFKPKDPYYLEASKSSVLHLHVLGTLPQARGVKIYT